MHRHFWRIVHAGMEYMFRCACGDIHIMHRNEFWRNRDH